ncbi:MAG: hypothetical protein NTU63_02140 [Candidatus Pacearchaeota archaeon]|nr:hypothetical protein [Candidatus Pacearchaeota archaeon]
MRLNFKKVSAIAVSALMVGMTMGVAAATTYPAPFVAGGAADVAIVYGTGAGVSSLDLVQAGNVQSNLQSFMSGTGGGTTVVGTAWQAQTGSDSLELGESIKDVNKYIDSGDLALLTDGVISNEKGDAEYEQFLYFEDTTSSMVNYQEDDNDNIGLFFKIASDQVIARYVMDFTTNLKSDVETADGELSDIEDKDITFLGKTYTVTDATNGTGGVELTLMSGALKGTVGNDEELTIGSYKVKAVVSLATEVKFTITMPSGSTEVTDKMDQGDMEKLSDGNYIAVTDITYEQYAGGLHQATFYIGADKIEWKNNTAMTANGETISNAKVIITRTESGGDIAISEIAINMTAEDDLYVPVNGKLSAAANLDEPAVLVSGNWDIEFKGLEAMDYEDLSLKVSESDQQYTLTWSDYNGDKLVLPLLYVNQSGVYGGDDSDKKLALSPSTNVSKKDYFLLSTADPVVSTTDAKTVLVQYKSADKVTDSNPKVTFTINPGPNQYDKEMSVTTAGAFTLKVAGGTFEFANQTSGEANDFGIYLTSAAGDYATANATNFPIRTNYIRTQYNTLITISDTNATDWFGAGVLTQGPATAAAWTINVTSDDSTRDGDDFTLPDAGQVFYVSIANDTGTSTAEASTTMTGTALWQTDPDDSAKMHYINKYGAVIDYTKPSSSPADLEVKIPKTIVKPLVYVTSGDIVVSSTSTGSKSLGDVLVKDSEVSSVQTKNLVVVGGSCINSVAAKLVGAAACSADFTTRTGIGSGQFLIQSFGGAYTTGKIALLVAGYEAADTVNAATYLKTKVVDTTAGKKYKGTSATTAELVTTTV